MPKMILVVDDKANFRTLVHDYLTEQGFKVFLAGAARAPSILPVRKNLV